MGVGGPNSGLVTYRPKGGKESLGRDRDYKMGRVSESEEGGLRGPPSRSRASKHIIGLLNGPNDSPYVRVFGSKNVSCGGVAVSSNQAVYINFEEVKDMMGYC